LEEKGGDITLEEGEERDSVQGRTLGCDGMQRIGPSKGFFSRIFKDFAKSGGGLGV